MLNQAAGVDRVPLLGAAVGLGSLFLPFLLIKEHRLASGEPMLLFSLSSGAAAVVVALLVIIAVGAVVRRYAFLSILPAALLFLMVWYVAGTTGSAELLARDFARGRVSPTSGFWGLLLSSFVVLSHSLSGTTRSVFSRAVAPLLVIGLAAMFVSGTVDDLAFIREYFTRESRFLAELRAHIGISATAVALAMLAGIPIGVIAFRVKRLEKSLFAVVNGLQTIPSLALFGLLIAPLALLSQRFPVLRAIGVRGIGNTPAIIALFLYSLLPIVRNTYTSLTVMDPAVLHAGVGMGMTRRQLMWQVEVPISLPIILSGIRVSTVQTIGNTTIAALIGAGGLGNFVFQGLGQAAPDLIVMGVIPIILLAVIADRLFQFLVDHVVPGPSVSEVLE